MGGPLILIPESSVSAWGGCTESGSVLGDADGRDDYDRACEMEGWAGAIAVGAGAGSALVLADEPAETCFLPRGAAVRVGRLGTARRQGQSPLTLTAPPPTTPWVGSRSLRAGSIQRPFRGGCRLGKPRFIRALPISVARDDGLCSTGTQQSIIRR
ncbi:Imm21 family immunity protein [Streptomyces hundungensis]|uniref:Imm21 family immunity protein n=2 Tax=Streptomyces TaxID=1883 RepID=UPI0031ECD8CC